MKNSKAIMKHGDRMSAYQTSKFAMVGLSESTYLNIRAATQKIKMSIFFPRFMHTDLDDSELHWRGKYNNSTDQPAAERAALAKGIVDGHTLIQGEKPIDHVGKIIFEAIKDETFYILVHPEFIPVIMLRATDALHGLEPSLDIVKQTKPW